MPDLISWYESKFAHLSISLFPFDLFLDPKCDPNLVGNLDQRTLFVSYLAPVQLKAFLTDDSEVVLYCNKMSNSPFGMVPLRYKFETESSENSLQEGERLMNECENLDPYHDIKSGKSVSFDGLPTMVDGKVKFTWSRVASAMSSCYICGATWKQMAKHPRDGNFRPDNKALSFGFSNLHVKMRTFEWVCKAAYLRRVKAYQCRGDENKLLKQQDLDNLIADFKTEFGYDIFGKKPHTGNVARLAFSKPDVFARITG